MWVFLPLHTIHGKYLGAHVHILFGDELLEVELRVKRGVDLRF